MHFLEFREPAALDQIRRILAIPPKKADTRLVRHLTVEEMHAILNAPEPSGWDGVRDRAMLHLCFAGGLRVSELVGLQLRDVTLQPQASIPRARQRSTRALLATVESHGHRPPRVAGRARRHRPPPKSSSAHAVSR